MTEADALVGITVPNISLWHDDVRPAPPYWIWVKNNADAVKILKTGLVVEISLDHDLGGDPKDGLMVMGSSPDGTGYDLVKWMIENACVPDKVTIHSWNPIGARKMAARLNQAGYDVTVKPYELPKR